MGTTRKYWKGLEELKETPEFIQARDQEFPAEMSVDEFLSDDKLAETSTARRDFLKFLGFSVAAATVAACEAPVTKVIPYVNKPEDVTPGMPTWYASSYYDGVSYASILVKAREGRPIYIKGNKDFGITKGGSNPQIIASVLGLYDSARLTNAQSNGKSESWEKVDKSISGALKKAKKVVVLSNTVISPTLSNALRELDLSLGGKTGAAETSDDAGAQASSGKLDIIQYDAVSYSGMREANKLSFGLEVIPSYDFSKAKTIVSVGADFLNSWLMSTAYAGQYGTRRNPSGDWMSQHFQFETIMSVTGSNADYRGMIKPSEQANVLSYLLKGFNVSTGVSSDISDAAKKIADEALKALKSSKGESLVVAGSNNKAVQILVNKLNVVLGAYGKTIDLNNTVNLFRSEDSKVQELVKNVLAGKGPDVLIFNGVNPVYTLPNGKEFGEALKKIGTTVSFSGYADETASRCTYICPDHHALEGWNDFMPTSSHLAVAQPTIRPLGNTRSAIESLLIWAGNAKRGGKDSKVVYEYMRKIWETGPFAMQSKYADFHTFWSMTVHNSCMDLNLPQAVVAEFNPLAMSSVTKGLPKTAAWEIELYQKAGIGTGIQAGNPWLQELPDPMTKVTWDNYITMNPVDMKEQGFVTTYDQEHGLHMARVKVNGQEVTLPVYPLPGQSPKTIGVALGYGRGANGEKIGKAAFQTKEYGGHDTDEKGMPKPIGANAFVFLGIENGSMTLNNTCSVTKTEGIYPIAATQIHHTVMARRSIVRETTLDIFKNKDKEAYNPAHTLQKLDKDGNHVERPISEFDLWDAHPVAHVGHRWGMTVDLSSCIGCGSCLIACQAENNVPVVGKDEVRRGREMHWLRIDRYFASDEEATIGLRKDKETFSYDKAEKAAVNPKVIHMPMMCHHCNHAPCETVCPVAATMHSNEGLNQMAYNRCIGTRYCANNCPYKVRRFNWFNYPSYKKFTEVNPAQDDLGRMVLNPDVTVRTRGVMEKCSFCVQRIQAGKLVAKKESRPVQDGDFVSACVDACPTNAIVVGDWNDRKSVVRNSSADDRSYQALEEVGVQPNVWYKVKVRNEENGLLNKLQVSDEHHSGHTAHGKKESSHGKAEKKASH
jgi:molybdopterin-containing oxidoreductase family iron-sulfur binding subunit